MTRQIRTIAGLLAWIGVFTLMGVSRPLSAQVPFAGGTLSGVIDVGGRAFLGTSNKPGDRAWARFGEYTNMYDGGYLPNAHLRFNSADKIFAEVRAFDIGRSDQQFSFTAYQPNKFTFDVSWNQTPHLYSTTSQLYGGDAQIGTFGLPAVRPTTDPTIYNSNSPYLVNPVANRWDAGRVALKVSPKDGWDVRAEYNRTKKQGNRPMGMSMGSPGSNYREILEPIDQITQSFKISQSIGGKSRYQLLMGYDLSIFSNAVDGVMADNPQAVTGTAPTAGHSALAPENLAHMFNLTGTAAQLPLKTRLVGTVAYSLWKQDQAFLPYTMNPLLLSGGLPLNDVAQLPADARSLEGDQRTLNLQLAATSRPVKGVNVSAKYRRYKTMDETPMKEFPLEVVSDRSIANAPAGTFFERETHPYGRQLGRFDVGLHPTGSPVSFKLGWNWERWNRTETREAPITNEHQPRAAMDLEVTQYAVLRTSFSRSWRRYSEYTPVMTVENPALRRFDQSDRDQNRLDVVSQITPPGPLGFTLTYNLAKNNYQVGQNPNPVYGVSDDQNWGIGGDVSYALTDRGSLFAGYQRERVTWIQRSRFRQAASGTNPIPQLDNTSYDWVSNTEDNIHTANAGLEITLVPDKLELGGLWVYTNAKTQVSTTNPTTPTGGNNAAQNLSAVAGDAWQPVTRKMHRINGSLRYRVASNWSATVTYGFQKLNNSDWRTDGLVPAYIFTGTSTYPATNWNGDLSLGGGLQPYRANYIIVTLGYNIGMTPHALRFR
ncbi:MAG: MtrB/PioB family outer membrane beta-barrel protein [Gemmatimonadetes bacterium]|nr:MtrB/PioB family outer membrane beta-barrel protein [Gemmatimonadota bacterium]